MAVQDVVMLIMIRLITRSMDIVPLQSMAELSKFFRQVTQIILTCSVESLVLVQVAIMVLVMILIILLIRESLIGVLIIRSCSLAPIIQRRIS